MSMHEAETAELSLLRRRRALERRAAPDALLAPDRTGRWHCVYPKGDRRRRPLAKLSPADVRVLVGDGAIAPAGFAGAYRLSPEGKRARLRTTFEEAPFRQQHTAFVERVAMGKRGPRRARGAEIAGPFGVLVARTPHFFEAREIAAARRLWEDHALSQHGLIAGSDWQAPPRGSTRRGSGGSQERAVAAAIDARRRLADALGALPLSLSSAVRAACLDGEGFETLEQQRRWPVRSGKLVLKLGLELLADHYRFGCAA